MIELVRHKEFDLWLRNLSDLRAAARIEIRLDRFKQGNPGDVKSVGGGISEMRIHYGPGYRLYFTHRGATLVILLCGGDKSTQIKDISRAKILAQEWKDEA